MASPSTPPPHARAANPDRESTGAYVRARRIAAGLTQRGLAELVGTGTRLISEIENDKPTLRLDAVNRVLAAFGKQLGCVDSPREEEPCPRRPHWWSVRRCPKRCARTIAPCCASESPADGARDLGRLLSPPSRRRGKWAGSWRTRASRPLPLTIAPGSLAFSPFQPGADPAAGLRPGAAAAPGRLFRRR